MSFFARRVLENSWVQSLPFSRSGHEYGMKNENVGGGALTAASYPECKLLRWIWDESRKNCICDLK